MCGRGASPSLNSSIPEMPGMFVVADEELDRVITQHLHRVFAALGGGRPCTRRPEDAGQPRAHTPRRRRRARSWKADGVLHAADRRRMEKTAPRRHGRARAADAAMAVRHQLHHVKTEPSPCGAALLRVDRAILLRTWWPLSSARDAGAGSLTSISTVPSRWRTATDTSFPAGVILERVAEQVLDRPPHQLSVHRCDGGSPSTGGERWMRLRLAVGRA